MDNDQRQLQEKFKVDGKIRGTMTQGSDYPQSPEHPDVVGTLNQTISFEGVVVKNTDPIVFRVTEVNDAGTQQMQQVREKGMQVIEVGQIFSLQELTGWDIQPIAEDS